MDLRLSLKGHVFNKIKPFRAESPPQKHTSKPTLKPPSCFCRTVFQMPTEMPVAIASIISMRHSITSTRIKPCYELYGLLIVCLQEAKEAFKLHSLHFSPSFLAISTLIQH